MSIVKNAPSFDDTFVWLWWRENKGVKWITVGVNDWGYSVYPHGLGVRKVQDMGGEWWSEPIDGNPTISAA